MILFMKIYFFVFIRLVCGVVIYLSSLPLYSQINSSSFEKEWQTLHNIESKEGVLSRAYADQLTYMAYEFCDTTYHDYYNQLSKLIVENHRSVREICGIDSKEYRVTLNYLSHCYTFGRFFKSVNLDYKPLIRQLLLSLEDKIKETQYNRHEFYALISNIYHEDKEFSEVIRLRKKSLKEIGKSVTVQDYFYDLENLANAYFQTKQIKKYRETASILFSDPDISNEQKQMGFEFLLNGILLSNDNHWDRDNTIFLFDLYQGLCDMSFDHLSLLYYYAATNGDVSFLKHIEDLVIPSGKTSLQELFNYYYRVSMYLSQGAKDQKTSIEYCLKAMDVMEKIGTCESKISGFGWPYYENLAYRFRQDNNYEKVIEYEIKGLEDLQNCRGINNEEYYSLARTIAADYSNYFADYNNAIIYNQKALASAKEYYGVASNEYFEVFSNIIGRLRVLNRYDEAVSFCDSLITIALSIPHNEENLAGIYNQRAIIAGDEYDIDKANEFFNKAIETTLSINKAIAFILNRESLYREWGLDTEKDLNYVDSLINNNPDVSNRSRFEFYYHSAVKCSTSNMENAKWYYDLADQYFGELTPDRKIYFRLSQSQSEPNHAKRYSQLFDAINIFESNHLRDSMLLAHIYQDMAYYYEDVEDFKEAITNYWKAIEIYRSINVKPANPSFLACLNNYGILMSDVNILKLVYDIRKDNLLPISPELRTSLINLISFSISTGNIEMADSLCTNEWMILLNGSEESFYDEGFLRARISFAKGEITHAIEMLNRLEPYLEKYPSLRISHYQTLLKWKRKTEDDLYDTWVKLMALKKDETISKLLYFSNSERKNLLFGIQYDLNDLICDGNKESRIHPLIADYSLFSKGLLLTTSHQIQKILRKDKAAQELYRECRAKRIKRNSLSPSDSLQIVTLDREIALLDKQISNRVGPKALAYNLTFSSSDLLKALGKNRMAIDFIMMKSDSISNYYAMIYKNNNIDFVPLFSKSDIAKYETMGESGINAITKPLFGKLIWAKILPYITDCKEVFFSPVGSLNKFAIELLPILHDSVPNVAFHRVLRLEREMFERTKRNASIKEVAAFGNIDYETFTNESKDRGMRAWQWGQLKATAGELRDIQDAYSKSHLGFYEKTNATESNFKNLDSKEVNLLHLATHGFYLSDKDIELSRKGLSGNRYLRQVSASDGQGRGGLLLSGANYSWNHEVPDSIEDGILSTEEIEDLSFDNLDLVVLSACETGLGESNTDGVWGLQRAFRIAGARRQVVSLLKVDDERTKEFMSELHRLISKTDNIYNSFRTAQLYMYNKYNNNPRFWASFVLLE